MVEKLGVTTMFRNQDKRYMTRNIADGLHIEIQMIIWNLIEERVNNDEELDYLQVFELTNEKGMQSIIHRQECPMHKQQLLIQLQQTRPVTSTVWCLDNGEYQMMLYPEDY